MTPVVLDSRGNSLRGLARGPLGCPSQLFNQGSGPDAPVNGNVHFQSGRSNITFTEVGYASSGSHTLPRGSHDGPASAAAPVQGMAALAPVRGTPRMSANHPLSRARLGRFGLRGTIGGVA